MNNPNFLCVGFRKSATTWLYSFLDKHPSFAMPKIKELNFFGNPSLDGEDAELRIKYLKNKNSKYITKLKNNWRNRSQFVHTIPEVQGDGSMESTMAWHTNIFELTIADYKKNKQTDQLDILSGDISPLYQNLPKKRMRLIKEYFPNIKIIFLLRDPVKRIWSDFSMENENRFHFNLDTVHSNYIIDTIMTRSIRGSLIFKVYQDWKDVFGEDQCKLFFFSKLKSNPEELGKEICRYLDVDYPDKLALGVKNPNPRRKVQMPEIVAKEVKNALTRETELVKGNFPIEYHDKWI